MLVTWTGPVLQLMGSSIARPVVPVAVAAGLALAGLLTVVAASRWLGRSLRIGLPRGPTQLRTGGLYRFSRNPIYLGVYLVALGGVLYTPHPVVVVSAIVTVWLHHRIVLAEERFLERRFGDDWREFRRRVPRYLGLGRG